MWLIERDAYLISQTPIITHIFHPILEFSRTPNKLRGVGLGMGIFNQFETICDVIITLLHYYALFGY